MNKNAVVLINQVTGPLFIDIANQYARRFEKVVLITGSVEPTYAILDDRIEIIKKSRYRRDKNYVRVYTWVLFYFQVYIHMILEGKRYVKALLVTNSPIIPFLGVTLLPTKNVLFDVLIYDVYPDALAKLGYLKSTSLLFKLWDNMSKSAYRNANRVITISSVMKELVSRNIVEDKIEIIHPWVDTSYVKPIGKAENWFVKHHNLENKIVILYSGNMGATHDLMTPLKVARRIQKSNPEFHFLFIGDGVQKNRLESFAFENVLKNVTFLPYQEPEVVPFSFASADFGLVSLGKGAEGLSVPSKTYYFLAAGAAILAISDKGSEIERLVNENNCGSTFRSNDVEAMIHFLLSSEKSDLNRLREYSRRLSENYTMKNALSFLD